MTADRPGARLWRLDADLTRQANAAAVRWPTGRVGVAVLAARLASIEVALMGLLLLSGRGLSAVRMLVSVGLVYAASELLGQWCPRARPFESMTAVECLVVHDPGRSFPSRHVASGLAMAAIGRRAHPGLGAVMTIVALLLGVSRVAAGVHYPTDIAAGAVLGTLVGRLLR